MWVERTGQSRSTRLRNVAVIAVMAEARVFAEMKIFPGLYWYGMGLIRTHPRSKIQDREREKKQKCPGQVEPHNRKTDETCLPNIESIESHYGNEDRRADQEGKLVNMRFPQVRKEGSLSQTHIICMTLTDPSIARGLIGSRRQGSPSPRKQIRCIVPLTIIIGGRS